MTQSLAQFAATTDDLSDAMIDREELLKRALRVGLTICHYNTPIKDAAEGLDVEEALELASYDAGLIYLKAASHFLVEVMPAYLRESHTAAGNSGRYPANGAERFVVEGRPEESEWVTVLRAATASERTEYPAGDIE